MGKLRNLRLPNGLLCFNKEIEMQEGNAMIKRKTTDTLPSFHVTVCTYNRAVRAGKQALIFSREQSHLKSRFAGTEKGK